MLKIYAKWLPRWGKNTLWEIFEYARYKRQSIEKDRELTQQKK